MSDPLHDILDKMPLAQMRRRGKHAIMGDGNGNLFPTDADGAVIPGYVWVRMQIGDEGGMSLRQVRNRKLTSVYNLPVILDYGYDKNLEVVAEDPSVAIEFMAGRGTTGIHAWSHQIGGPDPLWVQAFMFLPLLSHPTYPSSLDVVIEPYSFTDNGTPHFYAGETLDLTPYLPVNVGDQVPVVIGLDTATREAVVEAGAAVTSIVGTGFGMPFSGTTLEGIPTAAGVLRIAGVHLYYGQTNIIWTDWIADLREFAGSASNVNNDALYLAWRGNR